MNDTFLCVVYFAVLHLVEIGTVIYTPSSGKNRIWEIAKFAISDGLLKN
jgi:hypothetical protein